jgi:uncharacterized protein (TIGR02453 family)
VSERFRGWPAAAFDFYARLELDNSRAFWQANKDVYQDAVKAPFTALSDEIERRYGPLHVFRPYRDVRFAKDKQPYKTAAGAVTESAGGATYYVQVSATGLFAGTGMYHLASDQLDRYRAALLDERKGAAIVKAVESVRGAGYEIGAMESLKSAPRGVPKDHPRIELLRMKGLTTGRAFPLAKWMHTPKALERIVAVWDAAKPVNAWLERHVGPSELAPDEW